MIGDWKVFCRGAEFTLDGNDVDVTFDNRSHRVTVTEEGDSYLLSAFVARQATVSGTTGLAEQMWLRNRATSLIGFRIDQRGRLIGEAWVPKPGLTADEFRFYVRTVAVECDRLEYVLTGRDVE